MTLAQYCDWERYNIQAPVELLGELTDTERCVLARRRAGVTQEALAASLGCSRFWVQCMERGAGLPDRLIAYWGL